MEETNNVPRCKCPASVTLMLTTKPSDQAQHTHTTVYTRKIHEVLKKTQQLNTLR